jgi:regulator of Ty1 transposition protein 103
VPTELTPIVTSLQLVTKLSIPLKATISSTDQEYEKQTNPLVPVPSAPVFAARLNGLLKSLANAENAVAECVKAREGLILGLEQLLEVNRASLEQDKTTASKLSERKGEIEEKKQQVEVAIMQALGSTEHHGTSAEGEAVNAAPEPDRPEMEALTPPSVDAMDEEEISPEKQQQASSNTDQSPSATPTYQSVSVSSNGSNKRRRLDDSEDFPDLGGDDGIHPDVAEMLKESSA